MRKFYKVKKLPLGDAHFCVNALVFLSMSFPRGALGQHKLCIHFANGPTTCTCRPRIYLISFNRPPKLAPTPSSWSIIRLTVRYSACPSRAKGLKFIFFTKVTTIAPEWWPYHIWLDFIWARIPPGVTTIYSMYILHFVIENAMGLRHQVELFPTFVSHNFQDT